MNLAAEAFKRLNEIQPISDFEFNLFKSLVFDHTGIDLKLTKKALLESRLSVRMVHFGFSFFIDYYNLVVKEQYPTELQTMVDLLTTNETFFFREKAHFDYLQHTILPSLGHSDSIRMWSAASSSGEETYSLAMLLHDTMPGAHWELLGSDISQRMLHKARIGHYQMFRHEGIPENYLKKYCLKGTGSQEGTLLISPELRSRVEFRQIYLNTVLPNIGLFDVIFLRNVLIYFSSSTKAEIVKRIVHQLKPGGHLFISHTENLQGVDAGLKMVRPSIFQKAG